MRKIEEVIEDIKYGDVLTIVKPNHEKEIYSACMTKYDGRVLKDVKKLEIGSFLEQIPNIKSKIEGTDYYQVRYDYKRQVYESSIMHKVKEEGYKEVTFSEIVDNLTIESNTLLDSMIDLDTKIANMHNSKIVHKNMKKELVS